MNHIKYYKIIYLRPRNNTYFKLDDSLSQMISNYWGSTIYEYRQMEQDFQKHAYKQLQLYFSNWNDIKLRFLK
jgi:hypothetical protein